MDTDQLTPMAYGCIPLAHEAIDVLKSELGAACEKYRTEDDYLKGILKDVRAIEKDPRGYLDYWNLLEETDIRVFKRKLKVLREHIERTIATPPQGTGGTGMVTKTGMYMQNLLEVFLQDQAP